MIQSLEHNHDQYQNQTILVNLKHHPKASDESDPHPKLKFQQYGIITFVEKRPS